MTMETLPMKRPSLRRLLGAGTAMALLAGGLVLSAPAAASAQTVTEASCSGDSLVSETLEAGSSWQMCWRLDTYRGLVLDKVAYQPRDDAAPILVLDSIALAQLNVPYDTGATEYNDVTTYQVGGRRLQAIEAVDCPVGEVRTSWVDATRGEIPAICIGEEDSGLAYRSNIARDALYAAQGTDLVLHTVSRIGWYEYQTEYRFHDDGEISVRLGATGDLSPNDYVDVVNQGWPIAPGQEDFAVNHYHSAFWRVDFGIDSGVGQKVEKFATTPTGEHGTTGDTGHTAILETQVTQVTNETKTMGANREAYRVVNPESLNADGHARSYEIIVPRDQAYNLNPETDFDIAFTAAKSDEIHASYNLIPSKAGQMVTDYIADGETLEDPVAWVNVGFHHINRDEDQSPMPIHWQGFTLYPRDFAAQNPNIPEGRKWVNGDMRGVPNPNITPTPTASPTPAPTTEPTPTPTPTPTDAGNGNGNGGNGNGGNGNGGNGNGNGGGNGGGSGSGGGDAAAPAAAPVTFGQPEVAPGAAQTASAGGFTPGETVSAVMHSDPVDVGTFVADSEGEVTVQFVVPSDTPAGEHTLVLTGQTSSAVAQGTFTVASASPSAVFGALATTGTDANRWAMSGLVLLVAGAGLAGTAWHMRRQQGLRAQA
jgi:primary-amine oxidase